MTPMPTVIESMVVALCIGAVLLNGYTTWRVFLDELSETMRKATYLALIWIIPILGSIVVLYLMRPEEKYELRRYEGIDPWL